jgi:hypothetical protein
MSAEIHPGFGAFYFRRDALSEARRAWMRGKVYE